MKKFIVEGKRPLRGEVTVGGSKNAVLPLIAATLLTKEQTILSNVPDIEDVQAMIEILTSMGVGVTFEKNVLTVDPSSLTTTVITSEKAKKMRASVLLLSSLLARFGEVNIPYPGGCVLGKRPIDTHLRAFEALGATVVSVDGVIHLRAKELIGNTVILDEMSVTATENAIMAAVLAKGHTQVRLAAVEPHVEDLCHMLNKMGAKITNIGSHFLSIEGVSELHGVEYRVIPDYLETGAFAIASLLTEGAITIRNTMPEHLDIFWCLLEKMGAKFTLGKDYVEMHQTPLPLKPLKQLMTGVYPLFPTDLQAPFTVLFTQAEGVSKVFETLYEGRLNYLMELEKMRGHVEVLNPHQAIVLGPTKLKGTVVSSWDIRAGTAILLAALAAEGTTEINDVYYIDRGYERIEEKLNALGASITRLEV